MAYVETNDGYEIIEEYNASIARKVTFLIILAIILFLTFCFICTLDTGRDFSMFSVPRIIWNNIAGVTYEKYSAGWWDDYILIQKNLPRIAGATIAGASLAVCGATTQSLMNNPLASPYTMGMSSGACFGSVLAIVAGFSLGSSIGIYGVSFNAFIFGMIPVAIVIALSRVMTLTPVTIILIGVAVSQFFGSLTTLIQVGADEDTLQAAYLWQVGNFYNIGWSDLQLMSFFLIIGSIVLILMSQKFNILTLGDDSAKALGVDATVFRISCMALLALMTMSVVAFVGIIGFVGLIAPHMVRFVIGGDNKFVIPASILSGAVLLLVADTISRMITSDPIPVGAVMSCIGGPIFIYLILRRSSMFKGGY
ncbi:MAG: iron ABC transporter permease [Thermoplasmatales archaeon]|nr:iron ABC transporter permease [Thermoplasmatales archaeon]